MAKMFLLMAAAAVQTLPNTAKADTALNQAVKPAAPVELSDWLLSQPLVAERYPLGLVWATPEAKATVMSIQLSRIKFTKQTFVSQKHRPVRESPSRDSKMTGLSLVLPP